MMSTRSLQDPMFERVAANVWHVGGSNCSHPEDCGVYAVDMGRLVLVDAGCGPGWPRIRANMVSAGLAPEGIDTLLLTHCHVDHIGGASAVIDLSGCRVLCHAEDQAAIESGDPVRTAADWYGVRLAPLLGTEGLEGDCSILEFPAGPLHVLHTPGHTPGSVVAWVDTPDAGRVLFGQDIHGPFLDQFGSDLDAWRSSMARLLELEADVLCEGHYGVFYGADRVRRFIEDQLQRF